MEKLKAHYDLATAKAAVKARGANTFTRLALRGIDSMGLSQEDGINVVLGLQCSMLFKSMTTHTNRQVWQDVYHARCPNGKTAYIKLTIQAGATVIQFKEK